MRINIFSKNEIEPRLIEVADTQTISEALDLIENQDLRSALLDSSGIRRHVSAYLGMPRQGVRNVKLERGMETTIHKGEELTLVIADPLLNTQLN